MLLLRVVQVLKGLIRHSGPNQSSPSTHRCDSLRIHPVNGAAAADGYGNADIASSLILYSNEEEESLWYCKAIHRCCCFCFEGCSSSIWSYTSINQGGKDGCSAAAPCGRRRGLEGRSKAMLKRSRPIQLGPLKSSSASLPGCLSPLHSCIQKQFQEEPIP
jgi:hypothetical protein